MKQENRKQSLLRPKSKAFSAIWAISAVSAFLFVLGGAAATAAGRPITVTDLLALQRVSDPQVSPDGRRVLYTVATPDIGANRAARNVWLAPVAAGEARALTTTGHEGGARWSPDGRSIAFLSTRTGSMQLFVMTVDDTGKTGEPRQLTTLSGDVDNIV